MLMKKYIVYMDDGYNCYKIAVPAESERKAIKCVEGNGEVIAVRDVTNDYPISTKKVYEALAMAGFGKTEMDIICRTLAETGITED